MVAIFFGLFLKQFIIQKCYFSASVTTKTAYMIPGCRAVNMTCSVLSVCNNEVYNKFIKWHVDCYK